MCFLECGWFPICSIMEFYAVLQSNLITKAIITVPKVLLEDNCEVGRRSAHHCYRSVTCFVAKQQNQQQHFFLIKVE